jgi:hypothetical protein
MLAFFGRDKLTDGRVVKKTHYPATEVSQMSGEVAGNQFVMKQYKTTVESWSLTVRGLGRFGGLVTQECYVDEMTWNNTQIGDKYGPTY